MGWGGGELFVNGMGVVVMRRALTMRKHHMKTHGVALRVSFVVARVDGWNVGDTMHRR